MPRRANREEKSVCLDKIAARILSRYIDNVSGRQGDSPIRGNVAERQKGCRFRRKAVPYGYTGNVYSITVASDAPVAQIP